MMVSSHSLLVDRIALIGASIFSWPPFISAYIWYWAASIFHWLALIATYIFCW
jgi:hypothetical protein